MFGNDKYVVCLQSICEVVIMLLLYSVVYCEVTGSWRRCLPLIIGKEIGDVGLCLATWIMLLLSCVMCFIESHALHN